MNSKALAAKSTDQLKSMAKIYTIGLVICVIILLATIALLILWRTDKGQINRWAASIITLPAIIYIFQYLKAIKFELKRRADAVPAVK